MRWKRKLLIALAGLFVLLLVGLGCAWIAVRRDTWEFEALQSLASRSGGRLTRELHGAPLGINVRGILGSEFADYLATDGYRLIVENSEATKEQLSGLLAIPRIRVFKAPRARNLDDEWLASLRDTSVLHSILLAGTGITDRSVETIMKMESLEGINLSWTAVSDSVVDRLKLKPKLEYLHVGGPNIRSVNLVEFHLVGEDGLPPTRAGGMIRAFGKIKTQNLSGTPSYLGLVFSHDSDDSTDLPPPNDQLSYSTRHLTFSKESNGELRFNLDASEIKAGLTRVDILLLVAPETGPRLIFYYCKPVMISLEPELLVN